MKALVARSPCGIFAFSESGDMLHFEAMPPEKAASARMERIEALEGYDIEESDAAYAMLRRSFRTLARQVGKSDEEINRAAAEFAAALSAARLESAISRDLFVVQATNALDDMARTLHLYNERLYEWFSLHYPELKQRGIAPLVAAHGRRENFPRFRQSFGVSLSASDEKAVSSYAEMIVQAEKARNEIEKYVRAACEELMPNATSLVDALLAAKLLAHAGSMERMAKMPASTIQLLGAEKALFRHLKKQGKSPKFGLIFSDARIQNAKREKQGKIARLIAAAISKAVRIDFYSGRREARLREALDEELKKV